MALGKFAEDRGMGILPMKSQARRPCYVRKCNQRCHNYNCWSGGLLGTILILGALQALGLAGQLWSNIERGDNLFLGMLALPLTTGLLFLIPFIALKKANHEATMAASVLASLVTFAGVSSTFFAWSPLVLKHYGVSLPSVIIAHQSATILLSLLGIWFLFKLVISLRDTRRWDAVVLLYLLVLQFIGVSLFVSGADQFRRYQDEHPKSKQSGHGGFQEIILR